MAQAASNEDTNGLLRQYLPRTVSVRDYNQGALDAGADQINSRPRQILGYKDTIPSTSRSVALTT